MNDLEVQQTIVPLFDFTNSEISQNALKKIFSDAANSVPEIIYRQDILKGMISNWDVLESFTYQRLDFNESYQYCLNVLYHPSPIIGNFIQKSLYILQHGKEIQQRRSRIVQFVLLFDHLHGRFLKRITLKHFPTRFQNSLNNFFSFINKADLLNFSRMIKQNTFGSRQVLLFEEVLWRLAATELPAAWNALFLFEAYLSISKGILKHGFSFPIFTSGSIKMEGVYHPLIKEPIRNSLQLTKQQNVALLTGPNMSGKSTLLKAVGLCVYLAHLGLAVPATACFLPYFSTISISITSRDNLSSGYSHFMQELITLKTVVNEAQAGNSCFAVFDELFKGTNADDAQEILVDTITGLNNLKNSYFFISTHLLNLQDHKQVQQPGIKKFHIDCLLQQGVPTFTYTLKEGWSMVRIGRILFEQVGLLEIFSRKQEEV